MYFRINILIFLLLGLIGFYACEHLLLNNNYNTSWQGFIQSGEEFSPGNYPLIGFGSLKYCEGFGSYVIINSLFRIAVTEPGGTSWDNRYLVQIKAKSSDYEEAVASHTGVEDLFVYFATPQMNAIKGISKRNNGILESNSSNDSIAVRVRIGINKYRIEAGPILEDCDTLGLHQCPTLQLMTNIRKDTPGSVAL